ncbi:murein hydrolase activator EnvC family protein [Polaribacter sp. IC073]|uniref:murein hydrolase activator EnvC family protein n=1 Tax=Polaribacter sp. IC073 TaxID=2508540 RepID=UPI001CB94E2E|nr:peptidoglycan DD-metalloendopeptidase family protein [Polaribacter sp. IC073]
MIKARFYIPFLVLLFTCLSTFGQTKRALEQQRKKLKKEIAQVNSLLFKEQKKERNVLEDLKDLNQKIDVRLRLIRTINAEARLLSREISKNKKEITKLEKELSALKADYASMILKSYKSKSQQSRMMFLLSSQNFHQAYKRLEYMKQYTSFRKKQGEEIGVQTDWVKKMNDSLMYQKQVKDTLILSEKDQKEKIEIDKNNKVKLISTIKKKERKYKREIQNKIDAERRVAEKIDKIIRDEIAKANRKANANVKNKPKVTVKNEFVLSPAAKALAAKFELNKGKLPWPVEEGLITRRFGKQSHPTFPGITINSTGLHMVTRKGKSASAIFNGRILNILVTSEGKKNVLIQHGNYITSYNNLDKLYVQKGDNVKTGQKIGQIFTDKVSGKTTLIFVLYKNTTKLNPSSWILKR